MIIDYATASDYLGKKTDRPLTGRATRIIRRSETSIAIRYQQTDVVTYHADERVILQSGGWQTPTTKARINDYTRARVYQDRNVWYFAPANWDTPRQERMVYYDGVIIGADGLPLDPRYPTQSDHERKRLLDKQVSAYIKGYAADIDTNGLRDPSGADCWGCLMQVQDAEQPTQGPFGRIRRPTPHGRIEPMGLDHYLEHLTEGYYVPSLLWNAIRARGYGHPEVIWHMITSRKDGRYAAGILRAFFKNLKPALLDLRRTS